MHEQSETVQAGGLWKNIYGRRAEKAGKTLSPKTGIERERYDSPREAETRAYQRSYFEGIRTPKSNMPSGATLSPSGDLGYLRQRESKKAFMKPIKGLGEDMRPASYF